MHVRETENPGACPRIGEEPLVAQARKKLRRHGARALSTAELLVVALGSQRRIVNAFTVAERLVREVGVEAIAGLSLPKLQKRLGVGPARACQLAAAIEIGRRSAGTVPEGMDRASSPREAYAQVRDLARSAKEQLVGLYLDGQNCLIVRETLSVGTLNTTRTHPREVLRPAILNHALGFILAHNHPSGNLTPSRDDVEFTHGMRRAAELMGIDLYDHLVVGASGFVSLKEKGLI